ncbi:AraC family transcriptional regulator [Streptomyces endophyticus]|uniref:AraC family transcriptional regulator n=1 Tax=Streptomyces endophyticus TaxID=714166 RepID=A0ABU6FB12_9ACTN|nr:AraC family transcriptional regulator [Streptomyces endophyticus]MEB8340802.1 AraC family transcriptional regulator [Streptomyces endophyticus]
MRFSTIGLPEAQRVALWEDHNAAALIGLRCRSLDDEAPLAATEINLQLPRLHVARVTGSPHVVERTRAVVRRTPSDAVACYLTLEGDAFFYHDDGVQTLRPGQLIVCDADRPFMRGFSQGLEEIAVKVPRAVWREAVETEPPGRPRVFDFGGDLRARTLARLSGRAVHPEASRPVDEDTLLDLLGSVVTGRAAELTAVHLAVAKACVEEHLGDSGLTAARLAKGVGISERHLSRVFAAGGTSVPRYLLERRLERARVLLSRGGDTTVAEVAARCGFGSAAHFSHRFKERYGLRATDVLREARQATAARREARAGG